MKTQRGKNVIRNEAERSRNETQALAGEDKTRAVKGRKGNRNSSSSREDMTTLNVSRIREIN